MPDWVAVAVSAGLFIALYITIWYVQHLRELARGFERALTRRDQELGQKRDAKRQKRTERGRRLYVKARPRIKMKEGCPACGVRSYKVTATNWGGKMLMRLGCDACGIEWHRRPKKNCACEAVTEDA